MIDFLRIAGSVLLFCLVFGMSATVDVHALQFQLKNIKAIRTGLFVQFVVLPLIGFITVKIYRMDRATGVILLVITSSPGGSYSNWWCSLMNADLALSVTMTAISTFLSIVLLPVNLILYSKAAYGENLAEILDWGSLVTAILLVMGALAVGLYASKRHKSHHFNLMANRVGNCAGLALILFSFVLSSTSAEARLWERNLTFYFGVLTPVVAALVAGNVLAMAQKLPKPEVVTIAVESCYQNVGIALSIALSMFNGDDLAKAVAVPFYYGTAEAVVCFCYCVAAWKVGWTKAPPNVNFWTMLSTSYEILMIEKEEAAPQQENCDEYYYVNHEEAAAAATEAHQSCPSNVEAV